MSTYTERQAALYAADVARFNAAHPHADVLTLLDALIAEAADMVALYTDQPLLGDHLEHWESRLHTLRDVRTKVVALP